MQPCGLLLKFSACIADNRTMRDNAPAFTLAELLIALVILGVIATFTIPKVLSSQQNGQWNSQMKETLGMVSGAFEVYKHEQGLVTTMSSADLTPYMNYVSLDTSSSIDHTPGNGSIACTPTSPCLRLHSGAAIKSAPTTTTFCVADPASFIWFFYDPDGVYSGSTTTPGKSVVIDLHYNGRINTGVERQPGEEAYSGCAAEGWGSDTAPDWFSWN